MSCGGGGGGREVTGRTVFICLVVFFAVVATVNGTMMAVAIRTFGGVETGSAYQAGLAFGREMSGIREQENLRWGVNVSARAHGNDATAIEILVHDRTNQAISGLQATGRLAHPMDKRSDRPLTFHQVRPGTLRAETTRASGQWDLLTELSQDGIPKFRSRNRLTLP